jgi:DNA-binding transcriptional MerR regulator
MKTNKTNAMFNELLTSGEVARMLEVSVETVRRWHKSKKLVPEIVDKRKARTFRWYTRKQVSVFMRSHANE